jgi:tetratricopeptide (TPR) repeat protein
VAWARQAWVIAAGALLLAAWVLALVRWKSPGAWPGFIWFTGVLGPLLFLERQVHFFYLYAALPGLVMSLALLAGKDRPVPRWAVAAAAALLVAQVVAIEARSASRLTLAPLPTDFVLRRAAIATNALRDLEPHRAAIRARVVMLGQQPVEAAAQGRSTTDPTAYARDPWWDQNVRAALADGDAIRLVAPRVREVVFAPWLEPGDTASTIVAYQIDGRLRVADYASFVGLSPAGPNTPVEARLARAGSLIQRRLFREALGELEAAHAAAPGHPDVLINLGTVQVMLGDSTAALATLRRLVAAAPDDLDAAYNLGLLEWRLGRRDEARRTWGALLARAPGSDLAKAVRDLIEGRAR